jgi:hypothetical protein
MRLLIRHCGGSVYCGMLLAVAGCRLRVALPGCNDATEYRWAGGVWCDESGATVDIEFDPADSMGQPLRQASAGN